jgi:pimeloyl-ACP methyl ester carboxylesterase
VNVQTFDVDGVQLAATVAGPLGQCPPIVLLHGLTGSSQEWAGTQLALAASHRTYALERPGRGASPPLPPQSADNSVPISWAADQAAEAVRQIGGPAVVAAHSIAGLIAYAMAAQHSEAVAGLVLVEPTDPRLWLEFRPTETEASDGPGSLIFDVQASVEEFASMVTGPMPAAVLSGPTSRWLDPQINPAEYALPPAALARRWADYQREWVTRLDAVHVQAAEGAHSPHEVRPELVADLIVRVAAAARQR